MGLDTEFKARQFLQVVRKFTNTTKTTDEVAELQFIEQLMQLLGQGGGGGAQSFTELDDTPDTIESNLILFGNTAGDEIIQRLISTSDISPGFEFTTLIAPVRVPGFPSNAYWNVTKNDGSAYTFISGGVTNTSIQIDRGALADASLIARVNDPSTGEAAPTTITIGGDSFNVPDPLPGNTDPFVSNDISSNTTITIVFEKDSSGFTANLSTGQVEAATGQDRTTASISVSFRDRVYFGTYEPGVDTIDEALIKGLSTERFGDQSEVFNNVTDSAGRALIFAYPASNPTVSQVLLGPSDITGAWQALSQVTTFENEGGINVPMKIHVARTVASYPDPVTLTFS